MNCVCVKIAILLFTVEQSRNTLLCTVSFRRIIAGNYNYGSNSIMTECRDSDGAPVGPTDDIIGAIDRVLGAENSDNSQIVSLKALSLESASNGDTEAPLPPGEDTSQKGKNKRQKTKKKNKNKKASSTQGATNSCGLQGSSSPSAGLSVPGSNQGTPILPSTPEGTRKDPILVSDEGGSTSTELYASGVSDISQDENPLDQNNNNNEKDTNTTDNQTGVTGDVQNSSDSSNTLVNQSPPGPLDNTAPDSLGGPSGNAAISGRFAGGSPASGRSADYAGVPPGQFSGSTASGGPASGSPASGRPDIQRDSQSTVSMEACKGC